MSTFAEAPTFVCPACAHSWRTADASRCEHCGERDLYEFPATPEGDDAAEEFSQATLDAVRP